MFSQFFDEYIFGPDDELLFVSQEEEELIKHLKHKPPPRKYYTASIGYSNDGEFDDLNRLRKSDRELATLKLDERIFCDKLDSFNIDTFYASATFLPFNIQMRDILLSDTYFPKIISLWHADLFLENQWFDWMGTLQYSTLAQINVNNIPEINDDQIDLLDRFMTTEFLPKKICPDKKCIQSTEEIQDEFLATRPIAVILQQVIGDTALVISSAAKIYHDCTWIMDLINTHPDVFFIVKDHPEQHFITPDHPHRNFWKERLKGQNWIYLPPDSEYDTLCLSMHADFAISFNSRAGFDTLYWTTLVNAGDRYRHKEICYYLEDFHAKVPPKKRSDVLKFLYYAITRSFFIPGVNGNKEHFYRWLEWTNEYRLSVGTSQTNLKQATLQELEYLNK